MGLEYIQRRVDRSDVVFIHDTIGHSGWGLLRGMPAIKYLGVNRYTFPKRWRQLESPAQYDYLDYTYELMGEIESVETDLCAISNQNYESHTEFTHRPLIARYEAADTDGTLIVIADRQDYNPQGGQRPLRENHFVDHLGSYKKLYRHFRDQYEDAGLQLPLGDTENLFIQDNAILYQLVTGDSITRSQRLFELLPEAPFLPLHWGLGSIFGRRSDPGASPLDSYGEIKGLARWLRRRIEWERPLSMEIARELNRAVSADERVFDRTFARRQESVQEATATILGLEGESRVHDRYAAWFSSFQS